MASFVMYWLSQLPGERDSLPKLGTMVAPGFVETDMARESIEIYGAEYLTQGLFLDRIAPPEEMANLDIDPEIVYSFIRKNRDIIDHAEKTLEQHLFGCVYAIQFDESEQLPSKGAPGAGARYTIEDVDAEKIIAFCKIPNNIDRKTVYYSQSYEMRKRLADLKKGSR